MKNLRSRQFQTFIDHFALKLIKEVQSLERANKDVTLSGVNFSSIDLLIVRRKHGKFMLFDIIFCIGKIYPGFSHLFNF